MFRKHSTAFVMLAVLSLAVLFPSALLAHDGANSDADDSRVVAVPDRPTFSAAAATVPAGHAQLEAGGEYAAAGDGAQLAFPLFLRLGVARAFELRAGLPSLIVPLDGAAAELDSLELGGKVAGDVTESLSLGAMPFFDVAASSGDDSVFSQSSYGFMALWGVTLTEDFSIGGNLGASVGPGSTAESGPRELFTAASLAASYSFGAVGLTVEGFGILGEVADATAGGSLSGGWTIRDDLVVDLYGGTSATGEERVLFTGVGVTFAR